MPENNNTELLSPTKVRSSNLELFRIVTMILIVAHHYVVNSGLTATGGPIYSNPLSWRSLFLLLFGAWGKTGINCFVLITGYFMCKSNITAKKFIKLLGEIMFYRIVINTIFWISGYAEFSFKVLVKVLLPITSIGTGFTSAYLVFFLCIPFLNILVKGMNEKQHIRLLLLCFFTYILLGTLPFLSVTLNYVSWFIVLYFIASYVRIYPKQIFFDTKLWGWLTLTSILVSAMSVVACAWIGANRNSKIAYIFVTDSNTFLAVLVGFCSFMFFKNLKMRNSKFINAIGATTFGVLLIHANSDVMRSWLWCDVLNNVGMYNSAFMPLHAIGSTLGIFVICSVIDFMRIKFIEKTFMKFWNKHWGKISLKLANLESKICKKFNIEEK